MPPTWTLWLCFALGQAVHILKRAGMAVRSPHNALRTRREYLRLRWDALAVRAVLCAALFWLVMNRPELLAALLAALGARSAELPITGATSLIFGYFADSVLDWLVSHVPALQKELPATNDSQVKS
jgi:hypothetical protein